MRVITGTARGRNLITLEGLETRPTSANVKEAIFSAIQFDIEGRRVLDLFAGCGALGIEALSRGAESAVFIDKNPAACKVIAENLKNTGLGEKATVKNPDYVSYLSACTETFDIVFLDPPYSEDLLLSSINAVIPHLSEYAIIMCEHSASTVLPDNIGGFTVKKRYRYGKKIAATLLHKE